MTSTWRVACVRIPRFPIGAVWRHETGSVNGPPPMPPASGAQLLLPMALEAPPSHANDAVLNRTSGGTSSSSTTDTAGRRQTDGRNQSDVGSRKPVDGRLVEEPISQLPTSDFRHLSDVHWDHLPIVLVDGQRIRTATAAAGRARIRAGMTIAEARSRCAALHVLPWNDELIAREVTRATAAFVRASPQVTPLAGAPGLWWVGAGGRESSGGDALLGRDLVSIARIWHPRARVAIADSCVAARAGTWESTSRKSEEPAPAKAAGSRTSREYVIVPRGADAAYLAPAPLGLLTIDDDLRDSLHALGLHTIGDLARLTAEDVERRWGNTGLAAWHLARGNDQRRPGLTRIETPRVVTTELEPSVETTEPVLFLVRAALDRLVHDLIADGRSASVITITLTLDDARGALPTSGRAHTVTREVQLPRPLARTVLLLERCRALLDEWPLTAPVSGVSVAITATAPLSGAQGELLDPAWRDPAAADAAFARLRSTLGTDAIVRPVARDTHRPERAAVWQRIDALDVPPAHAPVRPPAHRPTLAFRQLDPPERADVDSPDDTPDAPTPPRALHWRNRWIRVQRALGPERLAGEWWDETYARDYWRVEDADHGPDLVVYRDLHNSSGSAAWYVQGWYD
jgi:protein ImuB